MRENGRRVRLVGPVILISLGVVLLLNNLGIVTWSVWEVVFRLWPVLLIVAGLDLFIGRRSALGSLLTLVLTLAVLAGAFWLLGAGIGTAQVVGGEEIRQALNGATQAEVVIDPGVGSLRVEALPTSANLVEGVVRLAGRERVSPNFSVENGKATFVLRSQGTAFAPYIGGGDRPAWELGLNPDVPMRLEVSLGAGESELDLTGLAIRDLKVDVGVGHSRVILPDEGRFQATVGGAIGQTTLIIPEGMAARIRVDTGLAGSQMPGSYQRQGDVYISPGYENADNRIDMEVSQAIGNITIRQSVGR